MEANNEAMVDLGRILGYPENPRIFSKCRKVEGYAGMSKREAKSEHRKLKTVEDYDWIVGMIEEEAGERFGSVAAAAIMDYGETEMRKILRTLTMRGFLVRERKCDHSRKGNLYWEYRRNPEFNGELNYESANASQSD